MLSSLLRAGQKPQVSPGSTAGQLTAYAVPSVENRRATRERLILFCQNVIVFPPA